MTAPIKPAQDYTAEEMQTLLEAGVAVSGSHYLRAAIHLLTFTELPGRADLAAHVEIVEEAVADGQPVTAAFVRDWPALARHDNLLYLTGGDTRLIALAASMAHGVPVDLRSHASGLGSAHAKRVLEAIAICLDVDQLYAINGTPALEQMRAQTAQLEQEELQRRGWTS